MTIDQGGVKLRFTTLLAGRLLEVGNLQARVCAQEELGVLELFLVELAVPLHRNDELELVTCHAPQLSFELVRIATEHLHHLRVLDTVE
jgi:hypothetical protein